MKQNTSFISVFDFRAKIEKKKKKKMCHGIVTVSLDCEYLLLATSIESGEKNIAFFDASRFYFRCLIFVFVFVFILASFLTHS